VRLNGDNAASRRTDDDDVDDPANRPTNRHRYVSVPIGWKETKQRLNHARLDVISDRRACIRTEAETEISPEGNRQSRQSANARFALAALDKADIRRVDAGDLRHRSPADPSVLAQVPELLAY
jgi:hypothetical protein